MNTLVANLDCRRQEGMIDNLKHQALKIEITSPSLAMMNSIFCLLPEVSVALNLNKGLRDAEWPITT